MVALMRAPKNCDMQTRMGPWLRHHIDSKYALLLATHSPVARLLLSALDIFVVYTAGGIANDIRELGVGDSERHRMLF